MKKRNVSGKRLKRAQNKQKALDRKLIKPQPGYAMVHRRTNRIVLATVRADHTLVRRLSELYAPDGGYLIKEVIVRVSQ
jgi:hypothetical protein